MQVIQIAIVLLVATPTSLLAQTGDTANPISQAIRQAWEGAKRNIKESAELMPEANYSFKPVDTVRTFGQILAHIAGTNYVFCAAAKSEKRPYEEDSFEKKLNAKADILKALNDSFVYCDAAYDNLTDTKAAEMVPEPFGSGRSPRASSLMENTGHVQEHYGNIVTYLRIKGMVPPSTARQSSQ